MTALGGGAYFLDRVFTVILESVWVWYRGMQRGLSFVKRYSNSLLKLLPLLAFAVPLLWLYLLDSASFGLMWKGRTFQLFFIWLIALELILSWETLKPNKIDKPASAKTFALIAVLLLPTV